MSCWIRSERLESPVRVGAAHEDVSRLGVGPGLDVDVCSAQLDVTLGIGSEGVKCNGPRLLLLPGHEAHGVQRHLQLGRGAWGENVSWIY